MPKRRIILAPLFMVVVLITLLYIHPPETVSAAASGVEAKIIKNTGDLKFTLTAAPASSSTNPHWKTVGF